MKPKDTPNGINLPRRNLLLGLGAMSVQLLSGCGGGGGNSTNTSSTPASDSSAAAPLQGLVIAGYQGWFGVPGDDGVNNEYQHWAIGSALNAETITVETIPDTEALGLTDSDLFDTGQKFADGSAVKLFSSLNPNVVLAHFRQMKSNGIDAVALQRFVSITLDPYFKSRSDTVMKNVMAAAEATGLKFFLCYDVTGVDQSKVSISEVIESDWKHLQDIGLTNSTGYLINNNKQVVELWGFGLISNPGTTMDAQAAINYFKQYDYTVIGGVPAEWRSLSGDSLSDAGWKDVYNSYDVISPWLTGRFANTADMQSFVSSVIHSDIADISARGVGYLPVIFPGFSWHNLQQNAYKTSASFNQIPRKAGNFMWDQFYALRQAGVQSAYIGMGDEHDEGTNILPFSNKEIKGIPTLSLNADSTLLPADWYMQLTGKISSYMKTSTIPPADLAAVMSPGDGAIAEATNTTNVRPSRLRDVLNHKRCFG